MGEQQEARKAVEPDGYVEVYHSTDGQWRWRLRGDNHEIVAVGEPHPDANLAVAAFQRVQRMALSRPAITIKREPDR